MEPSHIVIISSYKSLLVACLFLCTSSLLSSQQNRVSLSKSQIQNDYTDVYCAGVMNDWNGSYTIKIPNLEMVERVVLEAVYPVLPEVKSFPEQVIKFKNGKQELAVANPKRENLANVQNNWFTYRASMIPEQNEISLECSKDFIPVCYRILVYKKSEKSL